ncbi:MAG: hypothetical protein ACTSQQ_01350 [Candidatus Helarchaeota archaeon]
MPGITIKQEQYDEIDRLISEDYVKGIYSFHSPTDFIRAAISEHIKRIKKEILEFKSK